MIEVTLEAGARAYIDPAEIAMIAERQARPLQGDHHAHRNLKVITMLTLRAGGIIGVQNSMTDVLLLKEVAANRAADEKVAAYLHLDDTVYGSVSARSLIA